MVFFFTLYMSYIEKLLRLLRTQKVYGLFDFAEKCYKNKLLFINYFSEMHSPDILLTKCGTLYFSNN